MAEYHTGSLADVLEDLETGAGGLSAAAAKERLQQVGPNELRVAKDTPEIVKFLLQFKNFFAILLIAGTCC